MRLWFVFFLSWRGFTPLPPSWRVQVEKTLWNCDVIPNYNVVSHCHSYQKKPVHPSFGMTPTNFLFIYLLLFFLFLWCFFLSFFFQVSVIAKQGWIGYPSILLLVIPNYNVLSHCHSYQKKPVHPSFGMTLTNFLFILFFCFVLFLFLWFFFKSFFFSSQCHSKTGLDGLPVHPSFGMTTTQDIRDLFAYRNPHIHELIIHNFFTMMYEISNIIANWYGNN